MYTHVFIYIYIYIHMCVWVCVCVCVYVHKCVYLQKNVYIYIYSIYIDSWSVVLLQPHGLGNPRTSAALHMGTWHHDLGDLPASHVWLPKGNHNLLHLLLWHMLVTYAITLIYRQLNSHLVTPKAHLVSSYHEFYIPIQTQLEFGTIGILSFPAGILPNPWDLPGSRGMKLTSAWPRCVKRACMRLPSLWMNPSRRQMPRVAERP